MLLATVLETLKKQDTLSQVSMKTKEQHQNYHAKFKRLEC